MKAPRNLVEAVKKGERLEPVGVVNTRAVHIQRFTKAIAAYACVAVVLVATALVLPALLYNGEGQSTAAQSSTPEATMTPVYYGYPDNYVRPDLIWADEFNPELKDFVIYLAQCKDGKAEVLSELTIPNVGAEDAGFGVEVCLERESTNVKWHSNSSNAFASIKSLLIHQAGFELVEQDVPWESSLVYEYDYFAMDRAKLESEEMQTLLNALNEELESLGDGMRIVLRMGWQSRTYKDKSFVVENHQPDDVQNVIWADTSGLSADPEAAYNVPGSVALPASELDDSKKATVIAKKVSAVSYYLTYTGGLQAPAAFTISTYEIITVEKGSDFYYRSNEKGNPYQVGNTIEVLEMYAFVPTESDPNEYVLYRSYPYLYSGVEIADPIKIGDTYRMTLIDGAALANYDSIAIRRTYDTSYLLPQSGTFYPTSCHLIAGLEKIK